MDKDLTILTPEGAGFIKYIVNDCIKAFKEMGLKVIKLKKNIKIKEFSNLIIKNRPIIPFFIDRADNMPSLLTLLKQPFIIWFVDNPFRYLNKEYLTPYCFLFILDRIYIEKLKKYGFKNVFYLPLATNPKVFRKIKLSKEDKERYGGDISYVGSIIQDKFNFIRYSEEVKEKVNLKDFLNLVVNMQVKQPSLFIEDIFYSALQSYNININEINKYFSKEELHLLLNFSLGRSANNLQKVSILKSIKDFNPILYGNYDNEELRKEKMIERGRVDYINELPKVYNASKINLNIFPIQLKTGLNQKVFDVTACGSLLFCDFRSDLLTLFSIKDEIICYRDIEELKKLIPYYLKKDKEREEIGRKAQERTLKEHTYKKRMKDMLNLFLEASKSLYN